MNSKSHLPRISGLVSGCMALTFLLSCEPSKDATAQSDKPAAAPAAATGPVRYDPQPGGGTVKIEGTSNIHEWSMESPVIGGSLEVDPGFPASALKGGAAAKPKVEAFIPVRSLKSYAKKMDEVYQEQMEEPKFKQMKYQLKELKAKSAAPTNGKCEFDAVGTLTVHGKAKELTMPVTIEALEGGKQLKITGATPLKMTDFGVEPINKEIAGQKISTGDDIKMKFEWTTVRKEPAAK
jgi:hypothetical protein